MAKIYNMSGGPLIPSIYDKKNKGREYVLKITFEHIDDPDKSWTNIDWTMVTIGDVLKKKGDSIKCIYDLGDYWEHDVKLMEIHNYPPKAEREPYLLDEKMLVRPMM